MRVLQAKTKRPLDLLAIGAGGHIAAACSTFGVRGDVDVWGIGSGKHCFTQTIYQRETRSLAFTPDGQRLILSASGVIQFFNLQTWTLALEFEPFLAYPDSILSADGNRLIATESLAGEGAIECWTGIANHRMLSDWAVDPHEFCHFNTPALSSDAKRFAVSHRTDDIRPTRSVQLRDATTGSLQTSIAVSTADPIHQLLFSADGSKLLARTDGRLVSVFDAATGQPVGELVHPGRPYVSGMAVHPNGTVACSRNNGTVCLWNLEKRELVRTLDWKLGKLVSVAFSPDGNIGAAGTEDGQVIVWDVDE